MEEMKAEVVDVEPESVKVPSKIADEDLQEVVDIAQTIDHILRGIGTMERQKAKMISQTQTLQEKIETIAKESLIKAGVPADKIEEYKVDLQQGNIVANSDLRQNNQTIRTS